jgi:hypothetical protein
MTRSAPLSPDARRLLELGSKVEPPTAEQSDRLDRALAPLFRAGRVGAASSSGSSLAVERDATTGDPHSFARQSAVAERSAIHRRPSLRPAPRPVESLLGLARGKPWFAFGALAITASASFWLGRVSSPAEDARRLDPAVVASVLATPTLSTLPRPPSAALASAAPVAASASPAPSGEASPAPTAALGAPAIHASLDLERRRVPAARPRESSGLAAEIEQLARVEAALRQGRAEQALILLERRTVHQLLEQAAALRAIASCELGVAAAARAARDVLERWPASAFQPRIANSCGL